MRSTVREPARRLPVTDHGDVLVAGGGIAGIAAALAATRQGKRVILVERGWQLGGLATAGLITLYLPLCDGKGRQISYGIAEELLWLSLKHGSEGWDPVSWRTPHTAAERAAAERMGGAFNPSLFALEAEKLLRQAGVILWYGSSVCAVRRRGDRIRAVVVETPSGRCAVTVGGVVDATGDAAVCQLANAPTALFAQGNILAAWYYYYDGTQVKCRPMGAADRPDKEKEAGMAETPELLVDRRFGGLSGTELSEMTCLSHDVILNDVLAHRADNPAFVPVTIPTTPQVRMTRRLQGVCTPDDEPVEVCYPDSVGAFGDWRKAGPAYELPLGSLYCGSIANLAVAGRCISVTDAMWDITRVIPVCAVSGEAAGTALALFPDIRKADIPLLQETLRAAGGRCTLKEIIEQ